MKVPVGPREDPAAAQSRSLQEATLLKVETSSLQKRDIYSGKGTNRWLPWAGARAAVDYEGGGKFGEGGMKLSYILIVMVTQLHAFVKLAKP